MEDQVAYLRERLRMGDLQLEQLGLAAYCGHEAASQLTGIVRGPAELIEWLRGLRSVGRWPWLTGIHASLDSIARSWAETPGRAALVRQLDAVAESLAAAGDTGSREITRIPLVPWAHDWLSPSRHAYEAVALALGHLLEEATGPWQPVHEVPLAVRRGTAGDVLDALLAAGASASRQGEGVVVIHDVGVHDLGAVVRTIIAAGHDTDEARAILARSLHTMWVFEAWEFGRFDGRGAIVRRLERWSLGPMEPGKQRG